MDEGIRNALGNEVMAELMQLDALPAGSEEKARAIDGVVKLYKLGLDENKQDNEIEMQFAKLNNEAVSQQDGRWDRFIKYGLEAGAILVPAVVSIMFMDRGFRFEQTGTYTSRTFQNLFSVFKPKR